MPQEHIQHIADKGFDILHGSGELVDARVSMINQPQKSFFLYNTSYGRYGFLLYSIQETADTWQRLLTLEPARLDVHVTHLCAEKELPQQEQENNAKILMLIALGKAQKLGVVLLSVSFTRPESKSFFEGVSACAELPVQFEDVFHGLDEAYTFKAVFELQKKLVK